MVLENVVIYVLCEESFKNTDSNKFKKKMHVIFKS